MQNLQYIPYCLTKAITKSEGPKNFLAAPRMMSFSELPAVKKTPYLVQVERNYGPSYFVMALLCDVICYMGEYPVCAVKLIHTTLDDNVVISLKNFLF